MDKINTTEHDIASCNGCFARNFGADGDGVGEYAQDLYDVRIGSLVACLCPKCLGALEQRIGRVLRNRALPEVFAIVKCSDFALRVVKGKMEIVDAGVRVTVKIDAFTESVYTFETEAAQYFIFDTQAEAEARLVELTTRPVE